MPLTVPVLKSDRLLLRPFLLSDAASVQRLAGNRKIADTTLNIPHPYEDGMAATWISTHEPKAAAGELATFAITLAADSSLIGAIGLKLDRVFSRAELGYWVGEPYWGQGFCTEAATRVVRYAFSDLNLHRVHASYLARNPASGRVLDKIGMVHEGVARQHTKKWGRFEDLVLCGLLRSDLS